MIGNAGIVAVILAGGRSRRMGGVDKAWLPWRGSSLIETLAEALLAQVDDVLVVANHLPERYAAIGLRCVADRRAEYPGPMAGLEAGFYASDARWVLSVPVDVPHLPADLLSRLLASAETTGCVRARDVDGVQPLIAVYRRKLALPSLVQALDAGERAMHRWQTSVNIAEVDFSPHRFGNLNTPADLREEGM
ncbi:MAG: molybdenum cofactor guanylyltransferase [Gammaproteobacteria bacterium HGW-Gammaproteobacteria-2]|nr:MAG: molybdenum cofactor guanylyltransferase [Gammaproteobacteria bacterium HGW-Gammaproteobacteria-2]